MVVLIFITAIVLLVIARHSSDKTLGILAAFIMMFLLVVGNHTNLDWENYAEGYSVELDGHPTEWLYFVLRSWSKSVFGLSYEWFRFFLSLLAFLFMFFAINKYIDTKNEYFCDILLLYIMFPFFWSIPVNRNFIGFAFFLFSVRYLSVFSIRNVLLYLFFIILAGGIQASFLLCILFLAVYALNNDGIISKLFKIGIAALFAVTFFPDSFLGPVQDYMTLIGDDRLRYVEEVQTKYGYFVAIFKQLLLFFAARYGYNIVKQYSNVSKTDASYRFIKTVYLLTIVAFVFCPLYRIQANFTRMINNIIPLIYIQYACVMTVLHKEHGFLLRKRLLKRYSSIVVVIAAFFMILLIIPHWEDIYLPALTDNWILNLIIP